MFFLFLFIVILILNRHFFLLTKFKGLWTLLLYFFALYLSQWSYFLKLSWNLCPPLCGECVLPLGYNRCLRLLYSSQVPEVARGAAHLTHPTSLLKSPEIRKNLESIYRGFYFLKSAGVWICGHVAWLSSWAIWRIPPPPHSNQLLPPPPSCFKSADTRPDLYCPSTHIHTPTWTDKRRKFPENLVNLESILEPVFKLLVIHDYSFSLDTLHLSQTSWRHIDFIITKLNLMTFCS